jgi:hypothetical protein
MIDPAAGEAPARALAAEVVEAVVTKTGRVLIGALAGVPTDSELVDAVVSGHGRLGNLAVALAPVWPVVAVGGPAPVFYPEIGRRLGCRVVLPEHGDVANAVGAAVAMIRARAVAEISSDGMGGYRVHAGAAPVLVADATQALALAVAQSREMAILRACSFGVVDAVVNVHIDRIDLPNISGDDGLVAATIVAECWQAGAG